MDENTKEFVLAYVALCRKHELCIIPEAWHGALCLASYNKDWVEDIALSEGVETYKALEEV